MRMGKWEIRRVNETEFPSILDVQRLSVNAGDVVVLHVDGWMSTEQMATLKVQLEPVILPLQVKVLVLPRDVSITVMGADR
jgi:hypothetical protein